MAPKLAMSHFEAVMDANDALNFTMIGCAADELDGLNWNRGLSSLTLANVKGSIGGQVLAPLSVLSIKITQASIQSGFVMPQSLKVSLDGVKMPVDATLRWASHQSVEALSIKNTSISALKQISLNNPSGLVSQELKSTGMSDFSGLREMASLKSLSVTDSSDIAYLPDLPFGIVSLDISGTSIQDLSTLEGRSGLTIIARNMRHSNIMQCPTGVKSCIFDF